MTAQVQFDDYVGGDADHRRRPYWAGCRDAAEPTWQKRLVAHRSGAPCTVCRQGLLLKSIAFILACRRRSTVLRPASSMAHADLVPCMRALCVDRCRTVAIMDYEGRYAMAHINQSYSALYDLVRRLRGRCLRPMLPAAACCRHGAWVQGQPAGPAPAQPGRDSLDRPPFFPCPERDRSCSVTSPLRN